MMKKMTALLLSVFLLMSVTPVIVADDSLISPHASYYLDSCTIALTPEGNRKMTVDYVVNGTGVMTDIGATKVQIQRYDDYLEDWVDYTPLGGSQHQKRC